MSFYGFVKSFTTKTTNLKYGRDVIVRFMRESAHGSKELDILDIGCGHCNDLYGIRDSLPGVRTRLHGIDFRPREFYGVKEDVDFKTCNIESEPLPFASGSMDYVVCNQIYEHCKEIFFMTSEIARVLKPGGKAIIGVPNLSSLHSLALLLAGRQPSPIFIIGPHVRGFCLNGFKDLFEFAGTFRTLAVSGAGFYPFPAGMARKLARLFPKYSVSLMGLFEKTGSDSFYLESLRKIEVESGFKGWTY